MEKVTQRIIKITYRRNVQNKEPEIVSNYPVDETKVKLEKDNGGWYSW